MFEKLDSCTYEFWKPMCKTTPVDNKQVSLHFMQLIKTRIDLFIYLYKF